MLSIIKLIFLIIVDEAQNTTKLIREVSACITARVISTCLFWEKIRIA